MARSSRDGMGRACPLCPGISDVNFFRYGKGIVHLDAEISDGTFDLGVAEQKLHRSKVAGAPIDQRRLRPAQRMRAKQFRVQSNTGDPPGDKPCVLLRAHVEPAGDDLDSFCRLARDRPGDLFFLQRQAQQNPAWHRCGRD